MTMMTAAVGMPTGASASSTRPSTGSPSSAQPFSETLDACQNSESGQRSETQDGAAPGSCSNADGTQASSVTSGGPAASGTTPAPPAKSSQSKSTIARPQATGAKQDGDAVASAGTVDAVANGIAGSPLGGGSSYVTATVDSAAALAATLAGDPTTPTDGESATDLANDEGELSRSGATDARSGLTLLGTSIPTIANAGMTTAGHGEATGRLRSGQGSGSAADGTLIDPTGMASSLSAGSLEQRRGDASALRSASSQTRLMHRGRGEAQISAEDGVDTLSSSSLNDATSRSPLRQLPTSAAFAAAAKFASDPMPEASPSESASGLTLTQVANAGFGAVGPPVVTDGAQAIQPSHMSAGDPVPPAQQVAAAVVTVTRSTDDASHVTLHLQPAELGAVQIKVDRSTSGMTQIEITAAKPETLAALQNSEAQLHQSLDMAGVPVAGRVVTFHLPETANTTPIDAAGFGAGQANAQSDGGSKGSYFEQPRRSYSSNELDQADATASVSTDVVQTYRLGLNITA